MIEFPQKITEENFAKKVSDAVSKENEIKNTRNKDQKDQLIAEVNKLCREILIETDPSTFYLDLKAKESPIANRFRENWQWLINENYLGNKYQEHVELFKKLKLTEQPISLEYLPKYSFTIGIEFKLSKPYISKNDEDFYIIDNPILKDKVFRIPMIRPSGWKGALSGALYRLGLTADREFVKRVFGEVKESNDKGSPSIGFAGRMHIFPAFFLDPKMGIEVINPRERKTHAGTKPIPFEAVREGCSTFSMLYVPFDRIGKNEGETRTEVQEDIKYLLEGIQGMFRTYGFGAKTSSGFGTAEDDCKFEIRIKSAKEPVHISSFSKMTSELKIKEITDAIQNGGQ